MFESAEAYASNAADHLREARYILDHYGHFIQGGSDQVALDVGCGSGDVTVKVIGTFRKWKRVVGVDFNPTMIDFANKHNPDRDKYGFKKLNFNEPIRSNIFSVKFDIIFSFFSMQWMNNRRIVAENINHLLNPGGQAFLLIVAHSKIYEVWDDIAKSAMWGNHVTVRQPLNELVYSKTPDEMFTIPLKEVGLDVSKCMIIDRKNVFRAVENSEDSKIEKLKSVDPFIKHIPGHLRETYCRDLLNRVVTTVGPEGATDYKALLIVIQKRK